MTKTSGLVLSDQGVLGSVAPTYLRDSSRYGNDGVFTDITMVQLPSGLWVIAYNGATSIVNCGTLILPLATQMTLEAWVYWLDDGANTVFNRDISGGDRGFYLQRFADGKIRYLCSEDGIQAQYFNSTNAVSRDVWQHWAGVLECGTDFTVYVNGSSIPGAVVGGVPTVINLPVTDLLIGTATAYGYIALPQIYNYALSLIQVQERYESTRWYFGV